MKDHFDIGRLRLRYRRFGAALGYLVVLVLVLAFVPVPVLILGACESSSVRFGVDEPGDSGIDDGTLRTDASESDGSPSDAGSGDDAGLGAEDGFTPMNDGAVSEDAAVTIFPCPLNERSQIAWRADCRTAPCFGSYPSEVQSCWDDEAALAACVGEAGSETCASMPYCGQDAQWGSVRRPRFLCRNPDATLSVFDPETQLVWDRKILNRRTRAQAEGDCAPGWRLPTPHELFTLASLERGWLDPMEDVFIGTIAAGQFHTNDGLFVVDLGSVLLFGQPPDPHAHLSVACVRNDVVAAGSLSRYERRDIVTDDAVVVDRLTQRMWQTRPEHPLSWQRALAFCESSTLGGFTDWHVPDIGELSSLIEFGSFEPATQAPFEASMFMPISAHELWSSSGVKRFPTSAPVLHIRSGQIYSRFRTDEIAVLCVRTSTVP